MRGRAAVLRICAFLGCLMWCNGGYVVAKTLSHASRAGHQDSGVQGVESRNRMDANRVRDSHLHRAFRDAQLQRQRANYAASSALYESVVTRVGNATSMQRQLRMWAQYQHADLLLRRIAPAHTTRHDQETAKRRAIRKFQDAVRISESIDVVDMDPVFGMAERVHALNSMGMLAAEVSDHAEAAECFLQAIATDPDAYQPHSNLALAHLNLGQLDRALEISERALTIRPQDPRLLHNMGTIFYHREDQAHAEVYWRRALRAEPDFVDSMVSLASIYGSRGDSNQARALLRRAHGVALPGPSRQSIRLQLAMSHLQMLYDSPCDVRNARRAFEAALAGIHAERSALPDPQTTIGSGSMGYYAVYQGLDDRAVRMQLARIYHHGAANVLRFVAPHVARGRAKKYRVAGRDGNDDDAVPDESATILTRRIRVGFLSAFLYHHSVGLLLSGVVRHLPRSQFEVVVFTYDTSPRDDLTGRVRAAADKWVVLPQRDLQRAQRMVAAEVLDVLVFSEIGMHVATYLLAFAQLALRSAVFWGHAVTSGIDTLDYFVSSTLFRRDRGEEALDQARYSECLYEMDGLTTMFPRPGPPQTGMTRASLDLPSKAVRPHMVLVPQTLYKLHPDFDRVIQRLLSAVPGSFLVLPVGNKPLLAQQLTSRWRRGGVVTEDVYKRVFFVRKMSSSEFLALCEMSDLVLDPFPIGGGRSSLEVFSVGTPIFGLTSRTTVLQLTRAMYERMGMDAACCMFSSEDALVGKAVLLLRNATALRALREEIRHRNHRLYEGSNAHVAVEWTMFLKHMLAAEPPRVESELSADSGETRRCAARHRSSVGGDPELLYEFHITGATTQPLGSSLSTLSVVRLYEGDATDPFEAARRHTGDLLQAAFLGKLLWNMRQRFRHRVVDAFEFQSTLLGETFPIEIRGGDDLHQVVRWQIKRRFYQARQHSGHAIQGDVEREILLATTEARQRNPRHASDAWREARVLVPSRVFSDANASIPKSDCVALVVTTCKRLVLFLRTMASLQRALDITSQSQWRDRFCAVLVIDDNSSESDRRRMRQKFPTFSFYCKSPREKGHAQSLNLALRLLRDKARFLFYLEDDWQFRATSGGQFLSDAVAILGATRLAQILLNDQHGGYRQRLLVKIGREVEYAVHEFAVLDPDHSFAFWPGFSLNPGVWDLAKLAPVLADPLDEPFREDTDIFERVFSLRVWRAGLHVGYLHGTTACDHIGAPPGSNASAYVLNGLPRRFDSN